MPKKKVFDCLIQINHNDDQLLWCLDLCRLENKHFKSLFKVIRRSSLNSISFSHLFHLLVEVFLFCYDRLKIEYNVAI